MYYAYVDLLVIFAYCIYAGIIAKWKPISTEEESKYDRAVLVLFWLFPVLLSYLTWSWMWMAIGWTVLPIWYALESYCKLKSKKYD